ncbi:UNVERIFIED_CONTAM: Bidirectional sugar transporter SWEET15 [Sesamum angustifolium]|uniref:Bidirectional sugar transporter SWEET n=1 Tax=Sesamum angustifolium TaxID=2727405 RepID=A0AAW2M887_9LAMI
MAVFDIHHPWAFTFGVLGNIISIFVYLAPLPTFLRIYKERSTMGFDSLPYVVALFSAMLWMYYAFLKTNAILLISINLFGCIIEAIYIFIYLFYASKKARTHTAKLLSLINVGLLALIFLLTFFIFKGPIRVHVVGWICVAVSVSVFAAPLTIVFQVVRTRSVEFMPFPLSFFLTLSAVMWFAYGLFQKDLCVALPNVLGFFLGLLQMLLYGIFRNVKPEIEEKKLPEQVINIMVLGTPVHPVDSKKCPDKIGVSQEENKDEEEEAQENCVPCAISLEPSQVNVQLESPVLVVCAA